MVPYRCRLMATAAAILLGVSIMGLGAGETTPDSSSSLIRDFLERLTRVALPRIRDFRGVPSK